MSDDDDETIILTPPRAGKMLASIRALLDAEHDEKERLTRRAVAAGYEIGDLMWLEEQGLPRRSELEARHGEVIAWVAVGVNGLTLSLTAEWTGATH